MSGRLAAKVAHEFASFLESLRIQKGEKLGLAISGGPDSLALASIASRWAQGGEKPVALIVDHGLREASPYEASQAQKISQGLGLDTKLIQISKEEANWPENRGKILEHARILRYSAMWKACCDLDLTFLLTGHHAGDQVETFIMRLSRASGLQGLAGIQPYTKWTYSDSPERKVMLRPLLNTTKAELIQLCKDEGLPFVSDPTNSDIDFIRNRVRIAVEKEEKSQIQQSEPKSPNLYSDCLRLTKACEIAWEIKERNAEKIILRMVIEGSRWEKMSRQEQILYRTPGFQPAEISMKEIETQVKEQSGSLFGRHLSLLPLKNLNQEIAMAVWGRIFKGPQEDRIEHENIKFLDRIASRFWKGHCRSNDDHIPGDMYFKNIILRPMPLGGGLIVKLLRARHTG